MSTEPSPSLTLEIVWDIAESLIFAQGNTTARQVKIALQQRGYKVRYRDISQALAKLANEDNWSYTTTDNQRTYFFQQDTDEVAFAYLEHDGYFREVIVLADTVYQSYGQVGSLGLHQAQWADTNRYAYHLARQLMQQLDKEGYAEAEDIRPDLTVRLPYWIRLREQPVRLLLYYTDGVLVSSQLGRVHTADGEQVVYRMSTELRHYCLGWDFRLSDCDPIQLLSKDSFDPLDHTPTYTDFRTEPHSLRYAYVDLQGQPVTIIPTTDFQAVGHEVIQSITVANANLRQAVVQYSDDHETSIGRSSFGAEEFWARVRLLAASCRMAAPVTLRVRNRRIAATA